MNTELKRFDEDVKSDAKLQEEIRSCVRDNRGLVVFANERGYRFSLEDLNGATQPLDPQDLDRISGGAAGVIITLSLVVK